MTDFLPKVASGVTRRLFRENKNIKDTYSLRDTSGRFDLRRNGETNFKILLDVASKPGLRLSAMDVQSRVLPLVADELNQMFKSYRFTNFSNIIVMDKNSGAMTMIGRK
jgi:hypothetical protein